MAALTRELRGSYAFVERNMNLVKRYWGWEFGFLIYAVAASLSVTLIGNCLLYTSPSPRDRQKSRMPSSA